MPLMVDKIRHPLTIWRTARNPPLPACKVAEAAGVSKSTLSLIENGYRHRLGADATIRLCEAFPGELNLQLLLRFRWPKRRSRAA